ncbi:hypothetical protein Trydic_g20758 [Trypoxylus dichotomus]
MVMTVYDEWNKQFQDGRDTLEGDQGQILQEKNRELVDKGREIVASDANLTVRWISDKLDKTKDMMHEILMKDSNKRKVCALFVPHALTMIAKILSKHPDEIAHF